MSRVFCLSLLRLLRHAPRSAHPLSVVLEAPTNKFEFSRRRWVVIGSRRTPVGFACFDEREARCNRGERLETRGGGFAIQWRTSPGQVGRECACVALSRGEKAVLQT